MSRKKPTATARPSIQEIRANPIVQRGEKILTELGLDLSSSSVGWAVGSDGEIHRYGKLTFKSTAGPGEKLACFEEFLTALIETYWPANILIERPMSVRGSTTSRHQELLGIVRTVWYLHTGKEIENEALLWPATIKAQLKVPRGANHDLNKEIMVTAVNMLYGLNLKCAPGTANTDDDIADAIAVLTAHWRKNGRG